MERIAGDDGCFRMLAIDQRGSLRRMLASQMGIAESEVPVSAIREVKRAVSEVLAPHGTGLLTDPDYGFASGVEAVGRHVGLLLCIDESGYLQLGSGDPPARISRRLEHFSVEQAKLAGADAIKILLPYRPDATDGSREYQEHYARMIGEECVRWDIPFVFEIVAYELDEPGKDSPEYAARKPEWVIESARVFSRPEFHADVLKLEFPADLKYAAEYADGRFDGVRRPAQYDLDAVWTFCQELDKACGRPWVLLSAGVSIDEFVENVKLACAAGASGFLCGRAIWADAVQQYPNSAAMQKALRVGAVQNFCRANEAAAEARPWYAHPSIGGRAALAFPDDWFAREG